MVSVFLIFCAVSLCSQYDLGVAFNIEIHPSAVNGIIHNDVSIICRMDNSDATVKELAYIDVSRHGKAVSSIRHDSKITIADGMEDKFQAEGKIPTPISDSYLNVTLLDPTMDDSGEYTCHLYYVGITGLLKEKRKSANLTVTNKEVISTLRYLVDELSTMKTKLDKSTEMENALQDKVRDLEKKENTTVTFTAYNPASPTLAVGSVIIFSDVKTNEGQGYNGNTGVFTAPVAGYYVFHISIALSNGREIFFDLESNKGQKLLRIEVGDTDWQTSNGASCLAKLETGEEIKPVVRYAYNGPALYHFGTGDPFTYFSGYLLKML